MSLRGRVALLVSLAVAVTVAAVSVAAYVTVSNRLRAQLDEQLLDRARASASSELVNQSVLRGIPPEALGAGDVRIGLVDAQGSSAAVGAPPPVGSAEIAVAQGRDSESLRTARSSGEAQRVAAVPVRPGLALAVSQSLDPLQDTLRSLGLVLLLVGGLGVLASGLVGLAVARAGLRPVEELTEAAERVALTGDLTPIEVSGTDELGRLATRFNEMLAALADSRERQRQLVADAGHELRTPLTSLRTNLDLLAQSDSGAVSGGPTLPVSERAALLADVREQVDELGVLVGDVVELAREDAAVVVPEQFDVADVVERSLERVRRRAGGLRFDVHTEPWLVVGEPAAVERAVTNLLDNAVKWSPSRGSVTVRLVGGQLLVADQGPGIPREDQPHVFERFHRADTARGTPGSGLGLAIVQQAAARHGGSVAAGTAPGGGALLTMQLPGKPA